jgi:MFS family permease
VCLVLVFVPATALGATFPMAIRWFASEAPNRASASGALYALNTAGAAIGAVLAGFVLIPRIGVSGTTWVAVAASLLAAALVLVLARRITARPTPQPSKPTPPPYPTTREPAYYWEESSYWEDGYWEEAYWEWW